MGTPTYSGEATIVHDGGSLEVACAYAVHDTGPDRMAWSGTFVCLEPAAWVDAIGDAVLHLPDGRSGRVIVTRVDDSGSGAFRGNSDPPE